MLTKYDPERAPDPVRWLAGDESHLTDIIMRYHRRTEAELPRPRLHAAMHLIVENQVAMGDELPVAATVARLVRDGLSRHEAIHAVGWVLIEHMAQVARTDEEFDEERYNQEVRELTEERWRAAFAADEAGED
jgi:hypothetical protein